LIISKQIEILVANNALVQQAIDFDSNFSLPMAAQALRSPVEWRRGAYAARKRKSAAKNTDLSV
jgi:hypothetical protein